MSVEDLNRLSEVTQIVVFAIGVLVVLIITYKDSHEEG